MQQLTKEQYYNSLMECAKIGDNHGLCDLHDDQADPDINDGQIVELVFKARDGGYTNTMTAIVYLFYHRIEDIMCNAFEEKNGELLTVLLPARANVAILLGE